MSRKKIAFACDHRGFELRNEIFDFLKAAGYEVVDCGTYSAESCDYAGFMFDAAEKVAGGECEKAIGVCYTGIGSSIAANKVKGVRASLVKSPQEAELTRAHNDSNMLILGSGFLDKSMLSDILEKWLNTPFEGGRHARRVGAIKDYECKH